MLELIHATFAAVADWPTFQHVSSSIWDEMGIEGREIYYALSASGFVVPAVSPERGFNLRHDTRVQVSLSGMMYLPSASQDVLDFLAIVRHVGGRASTFRPSNPTVVENLSIGDDELREALRLEPGDPRLLRQCMLIRDQAPYLRTSFSGPDPQNGLWNFTVDIERARRFKSVHMIPEFLEVEGAIRTEGSRPWSGPIGGDVASEADDLNGLVIEQAPIPAAHHAGTTSTGGQSERNEAVDRVATSDVQVEGHDVFISHASEDKASVARQLAKRLRDLGYRVWYDEFELRVGMSLRRSIDKGLVGSRFGIVILSPAFFAKEWPQRELDGLVAQETAGKPDRILPVWHEVDREAVAKYSPTLADRVAAITTDGLDTVVEELVEAIGAPNAAAPNASSEGRPGASVRLGPVPRMLELSPLLLSSQVIRLADKAVELILDMDSLPPGECRKLTARLFDDLRDSLDILSELGFVEREEFAEQIGTQMTQLLDEGVVLLGGSYDRGITTARGREPWPGAVIKATPIPPKDTQQAEQPMSVEDATAIALAQVRIDKAELGPAEQGLRPLAAAGNGHALLLLGMLLRDQKRLYEAAEALQKAADIGRNEALTPLGLCLRDLGRLDEAEAVLLQAAERQKAHPA